MKTVARVIFIDAAPVTAFETLDDLGIAGMHMMKSSVMMMGSKFCLQYLTEHHTGPGSKYRWTGAILGVKIDFTVEVTKWSKGEEKIWETIGEAGMIIYSWFRMQLLIKPENNGSRVELSITNAKPKVWFEKLLSELLADWYGNWCLKNMLKNAKRILEKLQPVQE